MFGGNSLYQVIIDVSLAPEEVIELFVNSPGHSESLVELLIIKG